MELKICHLYPDVLDFNGDRGNIICLEKRLEWRGIDVQTTSVKMGETLELSGFDLVYMGGAQDMEQEMLLQELKSGKAEELLAAANDGLTFLAACGGYQLMGVYYETADGRRRGGIGGVDFYTVAGKERMTGNFSFRCSGFEVVGFENHSGKTYLGSGVEPLGAVKAGFGNNGEDKTEGVHYKNIFGTYSHGPVLPKNPQLADLILKTALERKYGSAELEPLNDEAEKLAHAEMSKRLEK